MAQIVRREAALADVEAHAAYLGEYDPRVALRFINAVEDAYGSLAKWPESGVERVFRDPRLAHTRMWVLKEFPNYLIFYQPIEGGVRILRVIHAKQDYRRVLGP